MSDQRQIRNFSIIAHVDHGKSTLADRLLELTGAIEPRRMRDQFLDQLDLERERGITIKMQPVQMRYRDWLLNLIDTPGHVDFTDEVTRSLAAVEGAILLVDATQGVQAQTVAHGRRAQALGLTIIPVVNKVDLPNADPDRVAAALATFVGCEAASILRCSAKTGQGVEAILEAVVARVPPPRGEAMAPLRARTIDSVYDPYLGVVAHVRVVDGQLVPGRRALLLGSRTTITVQEVGVFHPERSATALLQAGDIGYVVTGLKDVALVRVGDTLAADATAVLLGAAQPPQPVVFAGVFPAAGEDVTKLRAALEKLRLNDAALTFQPEHLKAIGYGFRCGFLGLLHLDVVRERLEREFGLQLSLSYPSVAYRCQVRGKGGQPATVVVRSPAEFPAPETLLGVAEPWASLEILAPPSTLSAILGLVREARGSVLATETFAIDQLLIRAEAPLASLLVDFYDKLKTVSAGYASLNVTVGEPRATDVIRLDVRLNGEMVDELATIVPRVEAGRRARQLVSKLESVIPREQFEIRIQVGIGGDILAAGRVAPFRKDVIAKLYGGDVTRKMKLLKKQKRGKARLRGQGSVRLDAKVVTALLTPDATRR